MNEEGEILEGLDANVEENLGNDVEMDQGVIEHGFEDADADVRGFATD